VASGPSAFDFDDGIEDGNGHNVIKLKREFNFRRLGKVALNGCCGRVTILLVICAMLH